MIELSLALGKTLEEIRLMPEDDFQEYMRFYDEQPFGLWREDWRHAQIVSAVSAGQLKKPIPPSEAMPFYHQNNVQQEQLDDLLGGAKEL